MRNRGPRKPKHTSPIIRRALDEITALRAEFDLVRYAAYQAAEEATNGEMLNRKGVAAGIDPMQLFRSNTSFAMCYASEELIEHWQTHPRPTFMRFEVQMFEEEQRERAEYLSSVDDNTWSPEDDTPF